MGQPVQTLTSQTPRAIVAQADVDHVESAARMAPHETPVTTFNPIDAKIPGVAARPLANRHPWDVRGMYQLTWDDQITVHLSIGGADHVATGSANGTLNFGSINGQPTTLNMNEFCARSDVTCPSEAMPGLIRINEDNVDVQFPIHGVSMTSLENGQTVSGLLDGYNGFTFGLGGASGGSGSCGAIALSVATGAFTFSSGAPSVDRISNGKVSVSWIGACAIGPIVAGASISFETGFTGVRLAD